MIVGLRLRTAIADHAALAGDRAADRALGHFPWLARECRTIGATEVEVWGHGALAGDMHVLHDGALVIRVGRPVGDAGLPATAAEAARAVALGRGADFRIPWDGRLLLLHISADGLRWNAWSDWAGSIPLFHAATGAGRVASTLEPVVVASAEYTPADFSTPSIVSLLLNGHFVGDWTLYRDMRVVPADCAAAWDESGGFACRRMWSVAPSDERWDRGWAELADEMFERMRDAILRSLRTAPAWTLPLSGGVDSRLIAAIGTQAGIPMRAWTYGPAGWKDTLFARRVAERLGLPWQRVAMGTEYLARHTPMWGDWFGSAMHFHGMYQMPFLEAVRNQPEPIVTGYIGDPHGGAQTAAMAPGDRTMLQRLTDKWYMWSARELRAAAGPALGGELESALDAINTELEAEYRGVDGAHFQKVWMAFHWSHVFGFSYYQPMMYDYWKGVGTPFVDRELARFTLSLPRTALEGRRLQIEMVNRNLKSVADIPVSFLNAPFKMTRGYLASRGVASVLPRPLRLGPLKMFNPTRNTLEQDAMRAGGDAALWPIPQAGRALDEWIQPDAVAAARAAAVAGDLQAVNRLEALQALALRLL